MEPLEGLDAPEGFATGQGAGLMLGSSNFSQGDHASRNPEVASAAVRCSIHSMGPTRMWCCAFAKQKLAASTIK